MFELAGSVSCIETRLMPKSGQPMTFVFVQGRKETVEARIDPDLLNKLGIEEGEKYRFSVRVSAYATSRGASLSVDILGLANSITATTSNPAISRNGAPAAAPNNPVGAGR